MNEQWYDGKSARKAVTMVALKQIMIEIENNFFDLTKERQEAVLNLLKTFEGEK